MLPLFQLNEQPLDPLVALERSEAIVNAVGLEQHVVRGVLGLHALH